MPIAAVVLAAGRSSRFEGAHKLLAPLGGKPLILHALAALSAAPFAERVVVTAPEGDPIRAAIKTLPTPPPWRHVVNPRAAEGLSTSLAAGLDALDSTIDAAMIVLADMPAISPALVDALFAAFSAHGGTHIVYPCDSDGRQGHPVIWPRSFFASLQALSGDKGGKAVIDANRAMAISIRATGDGAFLDIDTKADFERAARGGT
ncbi:MAG: nucleotidyltransferase family protein [Hyphomicrobium sp.]